MERNMIQLQDNIREAAENVMGDYGVPGMVIAAAQGAGSSSYLLLGTDAAGERLGQDNLFPVASITKLATALAVLRLVDSGTLSLDGSLSEYLPEAAAAQPEVTLRTLLSHSSGLPEDLAHEAARYEQGLN